MGSDDISPRFGWYLSLGLVGSSALLFLNLAIVAGILVLLGLLILLRWKLRVQLETVECDRHVPDGVYEQSELEVGFSLRNRGGFPLVLPRIQDNVPFGTQLKASTRWTGCIRSGERLRLGFSTVAKSNYGRYQLGPLSLQVGDPAGLVEPRRGFERYDPITLYPRWSHIEWMPILGGRRAFSDHPRSSDKTASGQDFYGIREYRRGDPLKRIHWRSVARHGELIVKQFELPSSRNLHLFVDLHEARRSGLGSQSTLNASIKLAASVTVHAIQSGHAVALHGEGRRSVYLPPRGGDHQLRTILETLLDLEQAGERWLDEVLRRRLERLGEQATVVLVVPVTRLNPEAYDESISVLKGRRATVVVLLVDDQGMVRYDGTMEEYERDWDPEDLRRRFLAQGAWCEVIDPGESLEGQLGGKTQWRQPG